MSTWADIQKQISTLIQEESKKERQAAELTSTNKKLEGLHEKIKQAEDQLDAIKKMTGSIESDAKKKADEVLEHANQTLMEATKKLSEASKVERNAQAKLQDAEDLRNRHAAELNELKTRQDKLKAALV